MVLNVADDNFDPPEDIDELNDTAEELAGVGKVIRNRERDQAAEVQRLEREEEEQREKMRVEVDQERKKERARAERERAAAEAINEDRRRKAAERREKTLRRIREREQAGEGSQTQAAAKDSINPGPSGAQVKTGSTDPVETAAEREARLMRDLDHMVNEDLGSNGEDEADPKETDKDKPRGGSVVYTPTGERTDKKVELPDVRKALADAKAGGKKTGKKVKGEREPDDKVSCSVRLFVHRGLIVFIEKRPSVSNMSYEGTGLLQSGKRWRVSGVYSSARWVCFLVPGWTGSDE